MPNLIRFVSGLPVLALLAFADRCFAGPSVVYLFNLSKEPVCLYMDDRFQGITPAGGAAYVDRSGWVTGVTKQGALSNPQVAYGSWDSARRNIATVTSVYSGQPASVFWQTTLDTPPDNAPAEIYVGSSVPLEKQSAHYAMLRNSIRKMDSGSCAASPDQLNQPLFVDGQYTDGNCVAAVDRLDDEQTAAQSPYNVSLSCAAKTLEMKFARFPGNVRGSSGGKEFIFNIWWSKDGRLVIDDGNKQKVLSRKDFISTTKISGGLVRDEVVPDDIEGIPLEKAGVLSVRSRNLQLRVWDNGSEDGDRIDLFVGGQLLLRNHHLTNAGHSFSASLPSDRSFVAIRALNEGSSPPNTASIEIDDGVNRQSFDLSGTLRINQAYEIKVSP